jgi:hypothetical protein
MNGDFRGRQPENKLSMTHVYVGQFENIAQEKPIGLCVSTVND